MAHAAGEIQEEIDVDKCSRIPSPNYEQRRDLTNERGGEMKTIVKTIMTALLVSITSAAHADWHYGKVTGMGINYDGKTPTFKLEGVSVSGCTCSAWAAWMCLNPAYEAVDKQYALLLEARAAERTVHVHLDETTCFVTAIYD